MGILSSSFMLLQSIHGAGDCVLREGSLSALLSHVVMIYENHAELRRDHHCLGELVHKLSENFFGVGVCRVVYENDALCILLDWSPALLILEVT